MRLGLQRLARAAGGRALPATLAAMALATTLSGCGSGRPPKHAPATTTSTRQATAPAHPPATTPATTARSDPRRPPLGGVHQLGVELWHELRIAGPQSGAYVYDLTTGTPVFSLRAGVKRPPASVEKLFTSMASLYEWGPNARLHTVVLGTGRLGAGGVWHGNLYLRGGGDPTLGSAGFNRIWELGYGPTASQLAAQILGDGIRRVTGLVIGDASLFDDRPGVPSTGFAPDLGDIGGELAGLTYDHGTSTRLTPGAFAAHAFALALRANRVFARAAPSTGVTPPRARPLAIVSSPPLSTILRLMNVPSDDFFAEMLEKQLGARFGGAGTTAAGAKVVTHVLNSEYNVFPRIVDGSGLSRQDRASPLEVVTLLRTIWRTELGRVLWHSLPTVGVDGTVATIATGTPAQGHCLAKTGTLNDVTNLAGYCGAAGGQVVAFAIFVDGPPNWQALALIGKMAGDIAHRNPADP